MYMIPLSTAYQFRQEINGFKDKYEQVVDNEAIHSMNYMQKKM